MKQLDLIKLARKAFREGSNIFGEKIVGYSKRGFHPCDAHVFLNKGRATKTKYPTKYVVILKLVGKDGHKCNTSVGFNLVHTQYVRKGKILTNEKAPFNLYLDVISGHTVFTIPVTHDMLHLFPKGLNRLPLEDYTYQELEERILEIKKDKIDKRVYEMKKEMRAYQNELGIHGNFYIAFNHQEPSELEDDLPF